MQSSLGDVSDRRKAAPVHSEESGHSKGLSVREKESAEVSCSKKMRECETEVMLREIESLKHQNQLFRSFLENSPNPICFCDAKGDIDFLNQAFVESFVSQGSQDISLNLFSFLPHEWNTEIRYSMNRLRPTEPCRKVGPLFCGDEDAWRWDLSASFDSSGEISGYQILGLNCKDKETIGRFEAAIDAVFEESSLCLAYAENLRLNRVTPALCRLLGYPEEELLGRCLPGLQLFRKSDEVSEVLLEERLREEEPTLRETQLLTAQGNTINVFILIIPLHISKDQTNHLFFVRDISLRKELEQQCLRTELLLKRCPVVLFQKKDEEGAALDFVSENVTHFGYTPETVQQLQVMPESLIHPDDLPGLLESNRTDRLAGKTEREKRYRLLGGDGKYRWVNLQSCIIPDEKSGSNVMVGLLTDVTKQVEAEHALSESHAELEEQVGRLEKVWEQTINLLAAVTELRDPCTMGHQKRVAHLAGAIAEEMGLNEAAIQETVRAALVHDIGKIKIPSDFLTKPGKLTDREFAFIKEHVRDGVEILREIDLPWRIADIVMQHHERLNGSGYPNGLKGEEILLPARIIAVADVVEAMASHRPYRPALGIERALVEVSALSGILYDAEVVSVCRRLFFEKGYRWPQDSTVSCEAEEVLSRQYRRSSLSKRPSI